MGGWGEAAVVCCGRGQSEGFGRDAEHMNERMGVQAEASGTSAGFTLIELLIVMSVMLILMTLAVPQLLKLRKQANEVSAVQSVRAIAQAELQYNSQYPANGFACTIANLGGDPKSGAPTATSAQLIAPELATGQKAGYTFAITNCSKVTVNNQDMYTSFEITAVPQAIGKTGDAGYCVDENNTIRKDPAGGISCSQPIQ